MAKQPYIPFYIGDYIRDTRMLPLNVRGAWVDIILQSWDNDGEVTGTMEDIGRMISCSTDEAILVIQKLKQKLIFDWEDLPNGEIKIICRRIKKMKQISETRKLAGIQGGNPNLLNQNKKRGKPKVKQNPEYEYENENENRNEDINTNEIENSVSRKSKVKKPEKTPSAQKHGFRDSEYFEKEKFCSALDSSPPPYCNANADFYYDAALNGSDSKGYKYLDWMAAIKNWIRKDIADEKFKSKFSEPKKINGSSSKFDKSQQVFDHNAEQLRRIMDGGL